MSRPRIKVVKSPFSGYLGDASVGMSRTAWKWWVERVLQLIRQLVHFVAELEQEFVWVTL